MVAWLHYNQKRDLILTDTNSGNYFIQREPNYYKYISSDDQTYRKIFSTKLLENGTPLLSLQGLHLLFQNPLLFMGFKPSSEQNTFVRYIFTKQPADIIIHTLKNE